MNNFDSTVKKVLIDASNWHMLGTLQPGQKFEVDNTNFKTPMNYIAKRTLGVDLSADKAPELIERGAVRITTSAYGGITRSVNRTWYGTIAKFEANVVWLKKTIETSLADVNDLKELIHQPMPQNLTEAEQKEFNDRKFEMFTVVNGMKNEIISCSKLIDNLIDTYAKNPTRIKDLNALKDELSNLKDRIEEISVDALSQIPIERFIKPEETDNDFAVISRISQSNVVILDNRPSVLKGWKDRLKQPVDYMEFRETEPRFQAPSSLVLDLHRVYSFKIEGEIFVSMDPTNEQKRYKEYYDTVCVKLGKEGADRLFMLLNQNIFADAVIALVNSGFFPANQSFTYDISVSHDGVVSLKLDLNLGCRQEVITEQNERVMSEPVGSFYKIEAIFLLDELADPDFYAKADPLSSLMVRELFDVSNFTDEQIQKLQGQL